MVNSYEAFREALTVLGLGDRATLKEIRFRHRSLVKIYHPDKGEPVDPEMIRKVNAAYRIVTEYIAGYHFHLSEEEFYRQNPEALMMKRFAEDPIWGKH